MTINVVNKIDAPVKVNTVLISVSDKTGVIELGRALADAGVEILSTGGTAKTLTENNIPVKEVSEHTGFPEMMDGRVKTLHPKIHGGILGRRGIDDEVMKINGIDPIDLVVVNHYPFDYDSVIMLAWTNYRLGKMREAKVLFQKALLIQPGAESALEGLSLLD